MQRTPRLRLGCMPGVSGAGSLIRGVRLLSMTAKELHAKIERHRQEILRIPKKESAGSVSFLIATEQSEIVIAASQLAEISTRRIVTLTWALLIVTVILLAVEVRGIFFPKDAYAGPQHIEQSQNQKIMVPPVTNR